MRDFDTVRRTGHGMAGAGSSYGFDHITRVGQRLEAAAVAQDMRAMDLLRLELGLVEVESRGLRSGPPDVLARLAKGEAVDPELYYFRTAMRFRSAAPELAWLGRILAVATGERLAGAVRLTVHEVA